MTGTCQARLEELRRRIGDGRITATVEVDQRYAHYQHERTDLHHPRGGGPFYLSGPLMDHWRDYCEDYAKTVLEDGGQGAMKRTAEHLSDQVAVRAPVLDGDLRRSGHPQVTQDGRTIYDRPPACPRLTDEQLREKSRRALVERWNAGLDVFWTRHGKVIHVPPSSRRGPW